MDFLLIVILMVVLYIVPELLKRRRRPERYEYPDIPPVLPPSGMKAKPEAEPEEIAESKLWTGHITTDAETDVAAKTKTTEEAPILQGRFTQDGLINGFIFAEIIRPPRAYRPMRRRL